MRLCWRRSSGCHTRATSGHRVLTQSVCMLHQEMADQAPAAAPLRRRAALVLSKWVPRAGDGDRPAAYAALLQLLASNDAAVQLAAINALQVGFRFPA